MEPHLNQIANPAIEIRKLPPSIIRELALILDYADSWKRLMAIIPKKLSSNGYKSDISPTNLPKYNSEHFKIIELGGIQYKRSCSEILFDEWGTSGRPRASLGHLKYLLAKAQLFRAADYLAKLLGEDPPVRPANGPAAVIPTSLSEIQPHLDTSTAEVEKQLDELNYPQIAIQKIRKKSIEVKHLVPVIPEIVVSEVKSKPDPLEPPLVVPRAKPQFPPAPEVSDMIKFSLDSVSDDSSELSAVVPDLSALLSHDQSEAPAAETENGNSEFIPVFSKLLLDPDKTQSSATEDDLNTSDEPYETDLIPALSILNKSSVKEDSELIPDFNMLMSSNESSKSSSSNPSSAKCSSPLPNLSLNTLLPHFTYAQLEVATENFSSAKESGRFLGAGAFGSVFLATGLLDKPVAVKKIFLENVEMVSEGDQVTKQFKNEVEVLYKYKHDNLVSLLGYSCDGCTYCLIYEYVPGGSLFDALQKHPGTLLWKQRVKIALGTARAVAYLHTAFSTPLIHRDIKSANILLDGDNNAKLCDFGIVKLLPGQLTAVETSPCGTSAYMSPEYHRGDISIKLDTFSFGVVLLELLTSLAPLDYNRQGADLVISRRARLLDLQVFSAQQVTYVEDQCEQSIAPILDKSIGTWEENEINFAEELYLVTLRCLEDKKKRPVMADVVTTLETIQEKLI
ncbi:hypothetical protein YQE_12805, partial [Dendroctonus ponderosae]